jgi:hypothetical protein
MMQAGFSKSTAVHSRPRFAAQLSSLPRSNRGLLPVQPSLHSRHVQAPQQSRALVLAPAAAAGLSIPLDASGGAGHSPSTTSSSSHSTTSGASSHVVPALQQQQAGRSEPDLTKLRPLPTGEAGRLRLPPTAPITWTFMITYLLFMLVVPIVALLVRQLFALRSG